MRSISIVLAAVAIPVLSAGAAHAQRAPRTLTVTSEAFKANQPIPSDYTCEGADQSPPLSWSGVPDDAKSVAILVEDPDAPKGTFTHWMVTNISPNTTSIAENGALPQGAVAAKNDKGTTGYTGACPPSGTHHYHFRVFALDRTLARPASRADFMKQIKGHVLAQGDLVGTYAKQAEKTGKPMSR